MSTTWRHLRADRLIVTAAAAATLVGCGPVPSELEPQGARATPAPTQAPPEATTPSPEPEREPASPPAEEPLETNVGVTFIGEVEWPPLPPLPPLPAMNAPAGGLLTVAGGWEMHYEMPTEQLQCAALGPDGSLQTTPQYQYAARTHPVEARPDDELEMTVQLIRMPHESSISSDFEVTWKEPGELRARAWANDSPLRPDVQTPHGQVHVSPDRRSVVFSFVTFSEPGGYDTERIAWMTVTGTITCPEPLTEIAHTPS